MLLGKTETDLGNEVLIQGYCVECKVPVSLKINKESYSEWKAGMVIQKAMPEVSRDDRKLLISGYCNSCWDKLFNDN